MKLQVLNPPQTINKVALVCIAHADDLLLFIGGSVAALVKAGWQVAVVRATDDRWDSYLLSQEQTILNNKNEFELAMGEIGVSKIFELELPTDLLGDYSEVELRSSFIRIIREFKPYLTITFDPDSYPYEDKSRP
jgi:LmbE family N-acetylglucosaminyl deacetylase